MEKLIKFVSTKTEYGGLIDALCSLNMCEETASMRLIFHPVFLRFELVFTPVTLLSTTIHSRLLLGVFWVQKAFGQRELFRLADVFAHRLRVLSSLKNVE